MRTGRFTLPLALLLISAAFTSAAQGGTRFESEVQYALEKLTSGTSTAALINGTKVTVMPLRTWKSVSGHYCRQYELTVVEPDSAPQRGEGVRCRDGDGKWKRIEPE